MRTMEGTQAINLIVIETRPSVSLPRVRCRVRGLILALQIGVACTGCAAGSSIGAWQDSLTDHIGREGNGDPGILRELPLMGSPTELRPAIIRFSKLGVRGPGLPPFADRWDVHGVLIDSGPTQAMCYAFLVGVVSRPYFGPCRLEDLRLVLFQVDGDEIRWHVGKRDVKAMQLYLASLDESKSGGVARHPTHQVFPALDDVFQLRIKGDTAIATERRSGATWHVELGDESILSAR